MADLAYRLDAGADAQRLLVLLHGYGATRHDIASIVPFVDPDGRYLVVSPAAPIPVAGGGASWYDFDDSWRADPESFRAIVDDLNGFLDTICQRFGLDRSDAVMGGFSQGAGVAAWLAFSSGLPTPAGVWCAGTIVDVDDQPLDMTSARGCEVLMLAGRNDPNVPLERSRSQAQRLSEAGAHVTMSEHDGGHGLSPAMLQDMSQWLAQPTA